MIILLFKLKVSNQKKYMNKINYQNDVDVINFKNYLNNCLLDFEHNYIDRRTGNNWTCRNLLSAFISVPLN